jgi:sugar phosphate isomerase/epimerase
MQTPMGEGQVDFDWLTGALRDCGYAGDVSIEYLPGADFDATDSVRRLRAYLEERLSE